MLALPHSAELLLTVDLKVSQTEITHIQSDGFITMSRRALERRLVAPGMSEVIRLLILRVLNWPGLQG